MRYIVRQAREAVASLLETYCHWMPVLPSLASKNGCAPCYSIGDLLIEIFDLCNRSGRAALEGLASTTQIERHSSQVAQGAAIKNPGLVLLWPIAPVLDAQCASFMRDQIVQDQTELFGAWAKRRRKRA